MIPLSVPVIKGNELKYVKKCIDTGWVSSAGSYVTKFEKDICSYTGADYAIACVNGTAGLHIALLLVGVQPGNEVIVPTVTFIAPVNTVRYVGADPIFMDCDKYYNIDVEKTIEFIKKETVFKNGTTYNKTSKNCIRAIIPVHVFGNPCKLEKLTTICRERNIKVIEDASESLGSFYLRSEYRDKHTGTIGDIGIYSFNGNKIITTGGGGMIVTNNTDYANKAEYLTTQAKDDSIRFIHNEIGYNFRLTNIQAAIGVAQLEKLPEYIKIKKRNYQLYKKQIDKIDGLFLADSPNYANSNHWYYCLQIDNKKFEKEKLMTYFDDNNVQTRPLWYLNHLQKPYRKCQNYKIENAYNMFEKTLNIPCSINLTKKNIEKVIRILKNG